MSRHAPSPLIDELLAHEAELDARELERITEPLPLEVIEVGCTGACTGGRGVCTCGARPVASWRDIWDAERAHPWLLAVYAAVLVGTIALSAALPLPWWGPR